MVYWLFGSAIIRKQNVIYLSLLRSNPTIDLF